MYDWQGDAKVSADPGKQAALRNADGGGLLTDTQRSMVSSRDAYTPQLEVKVHT